MKPKQLVEDITALLDVVNEKACELAQQGYTVEYETTDVQRIGQVPGVVLRAVVSKTEYLTATGVDNENES